MRNEVILLPLHPVKDTKRETTMFDTFLHTVQVILLYTANGGLILFYVAWAQIAAIITTAACAALAGRAPVEQRLWVGSIGTVAVVAALVATPPTPFLLAGMAVAGTVAVRLDRFNPDALGWRVSGGIALYAGAALVYLAYSRYLAGIDAGAWAQALGGQNEAQTALAQGQAFLNTLATWGLWLILPLAYLSLLAQGILIHPPIGQRPAQTITAVRTRGHG